MNKLTVILFSLWPLCPVGSASLGVVGQVFPISEIDMMQWINQRLRTFELTGELARMQAQFKAHVTAGVTRPHPVGLITTTTPKVFSVDPTLTLSRDITDSHGHVIYPRGTRINPFDRGSWPAMQQASIAEFQFNKTLVFFNGDDVQQVLWAQNFLSGHLRHPQASSSSTAIKWILTGGEPETVHQQLKARMYFDQQGNLSRALTIKRVPSVVNRVGFFWQVREIDVSHFPVFTESVNDE